MANDTGDLLWEVLGIPPTADLNRIHEAYREQVRIHHPDRFRHDPVRYRQQEERMKRINQAYQWALAGELRLSPSSPPKDAAPTPPPVCLQHHQEGLRRCTRCQVPLCRSCEGFGAHLCTRHLTRWIVHQHRRRALKQWIPLIAGIGGLKILGFAPALILWAVVAYLGVLGFFFLRRRRWMGCLSWLFFPYSFVLGGLYSLYESLSAWNRAAMGPMDSPRTG